MTPACSFWCANIKCWQLDGCVIQYVCGIEVGARCTLCGQLGIKWYYYRIKRGKRFIHFIDLSSFFGDWICHCKLHPPNPQQRNAPNAVNGCCNTNHEQPNQTPIPLRFFAQMFHPSLWSGKDTRIEYTHRIQLPVFQPHYRRPSLLAIIFHCGQVGRARALVRSQNCVR